MTTNEWVGTGGAFFSIGDRAIKSHESCILRKNMFSGLRADRKTFLTVPLFICSLKLLWVLFLHYNLSLFKICKFLCSVCFGSLFFVFSFVLRSLFFHNSFLVSSFGLFSVAFSCIFLQSLCLFLFCFCSLSGIKWTVNKKFYAIQILTLYNRLIYSVN